MPDAKVIKMSENAGLDAELDKAVPTENTTAFLLAVNGSQPGRVYPVNRNTMILGRADSADIRIAHPSVSSEHARIINGSLGFEIEDLGSTNGTYLGSERVTRARLQSGDRIVLGTVEFSFLVDRAQDATVALLPPGARVSANNMLAPIIVGPAHQYPHQYRQGGMSQRPMQGDRGETEQAPSLEEIAGKVITGYRFLAPYARLIAVLGVGGLLAGVASGVVLPPAPMAMSEARLQPAKKSNPVESSWRPPEENPVQFFAQAERSFTHSSLVAATLKKMAGQAGNGEEPDPDKVGSLTGRLKLEAIGDRLYRATYQEALVGRGRPDPVEFLDAHIKNYKDSEIEKALQVFLEEADFLKSKWNNAAQELQKIGNELAEFKKENADGLPETSLQANASRFQLDTKRGELRARIARLEGEVAADARQINADSSIAQSRFQASQIYRDSLAKLNGQLTEARAASKGEQHPDVLKIKDEIAGVEKLIAQEMSKQTSEADRSANAGYAGQSNRMDMSKAALTSARRELKEVESSLSLLNKLVVSMPQVAAKLDNLQRSYESTKKLHDQLFDQYSKANLQIDIERLAARSRFEVVTAPFLMEPTASKAFGIRGGIGMMLGLFLVALVIAVREGRKLFSRAIADLDATS
jgi:pSer/pThr/pTyr-binding forkhead associated (FHA) protein